MYEIIRRNLESGLVMRCLFTPAIRIYWNATGPDGNVNQVEYSTSEKAKATVEEESKAASVCFFIKFGKIHQCHLKFIAMLNLNRNGIEEVLKRCRKLKIILCLYVFAFVTFQES